MLIRNVCFFIGCLSLTQPVLGVDAQEKSEEASCIIELNDKQFESFIQSAEKPVVVDFWAPWCPPCMRMKPIFQEVASELQDKYLFVTVNFDEAPQAVQKYEITTIPTFKVIKNNTVIGTISGSSGKDSLITQIESTIQGKLTQDTLLSAILAGDQELVAKCLVDVDIDVNCITQLQLMDMTIPTTPLFTATSNALFDQSSLEGIAMLVSAGANIDLEMDFLAISGDVVKVSARSIVVEMAQVNIEEILAKRSEGDRALIDDEMLRQGLVRSKARALSILELFETLSPQ